MTQRNQVDAVDTIGFDESQSEWDKKTVAITRRLAVVALHPFDIPFVIGLDRIFCPFWVDCLSYIKSRCIDNYFTNWIWVELLLANLT